MKAVRLHRIGGPDDLVCEQIDSPEPPAGEVLVAVRAAALNHRDVFITQGLYPKIALPRTLGSDGAGVFEGRDVVIDPTMGWGSQERVWDANATILGMPRDGTFAENVSVPRQNVHDKPAHLSFEEAAALPLAGVTAYRALFTRGELRAGETLLITGVGGGVQTFALLFALAAGARVLVTSSSDEKLDRARSLGAHAGFNYRTDPDWYKGARAAGPVDAVIDSAGGESFARALAIVRPGGRVVTYGGTHGDSAIKLFPIFWNQIDVRGSSMGSPADFAAMLRFVETHRIRPAIDRVFPFEEAPAAARRMNEAAQFGKIVLQVSS